MSNSEKTSARLLECQFRCQANDEIIAVPLSQLLFQGVLYPRPDEDIAVFVDFDCNACGQHHEIKLNP